jgi:hypothetical protein
MSQFSNCNTIVIQLLYSLFIIKSLASQARMLSVFQHWKFTIILKNRKVQNFSEIKKNFPKMFEEMLASDWLKIYLIQKGKYYYRPILSIKMFATSTPKNGLY